MHELLNAIEQSSLSEWVRVSLWGFPYLLLFHTVGMAVIVGISAGIDLRILGIAPALPLGPLRKFLPILWIGFYANLATGLALLMADISTKLANPDFWVKMIFIVLALINLRMIKTRVLNDPEVDKKTFSANAKVLAVVSLFCWLVVITTGRLLAYVGPVAGL